MSLKRGQVSIFILISLVILIAYFFILNLNSQNYKIESFEDVDIQPIKNFLDNCVKLTSEDAVSTLGWQGGRIVYDPNKMMLTHFGAITYSYDEGENTLPSIQKMEKELEIYVDSLLDICIENTTVYQRWQIEKGKLNTLATITGNSVLFEVDYPMEFRKGKVTRKISKFRTTIPVRLGHIRSVVENIIEVQVRKPGWLPYSYLNESDLDAAIYLHRENKFIYEFIDNESVIRNRPYQFIVANRFKERNPEEVFNEIISQIE